MPLGNLVAFSFIGIGMGFTYFVRLLIPWQLNSDLCISCFYHYRELSHHLPTLMVWKVTRKSWQMLTQKEDNPNFMLLGIALFQFCDSTLLPLWWEILLLLTDNTTFLS